MTSLTQTPTRYVRPEYQVSVQSVKFTDGSQLVKADYVDRPEGTLPLMSREDASEVLGIPLRYISSAMVLPLGVEYSTWNSPEYAYEQITATRPDLQQTGRSSSHPPRGYAESTEQLESSIQNDQSQDLTKAGDQSATGSEEWYIKTKWSGVQRGRSPVSIYVRGWLDDRFETGPLPPGTGTKQGGRFIQFRTIVEATRFVGEPDFGPGGHPIIRRIMDPVTEDILKIVISRNEETCRFEDARGGEVYKARTPKERLWGRKGTGSSGLGGFRGYIEGEVEE